MEQCGKDPTCLAVKLADDLKNSTESIAERLSNITYDMRDISLRFSDDLKEFSRIMVKFGEQLSDIKPITREVAELKNDNREAHDFFGGELRKITAFKAEKSEVTSLESDLNAKINNITQSRDSLRTRLLLVGAGALVGSVAPITIFMLGKLL